MDPVLVAQHLDSLTQKSTAEFASIPDSEWTVRSPGSSAWTRKELLGHLIDSAVNNQLRFARALIEDEVHFPSYLQTEMVRVQNYREAPLELLTGLWTSLNRNIARLLAQIPPNKLATICVIGSNAPMTLQQLAADYVAHLEHHLKQLLGKEALPFSDVAWPPPDRWQTETKT
jgi:hypothetical protein